MADVKVLCYSSSGSVDEKMAFEKETKIASSGRGGFFRTEYPIIEQDLKKYVDAGYRITQMSKGSSGYSFLLER